MTTYYGKGDDMKILVIGAGAIGGYFGGRLLEAKRDVVFLVRPRRAGQLAKTGLVIKSPAGDVNIPNPPTVQADALDQHFDLILLSCKAYDLDDAIGSFAPVVGPDTVILPLLNGMRHLDSLEQRFGTKAVLGGQCVISSTMDADGRIIHLGDFHTLTFGERDGARTGRASTIEAEFARAKFDTELVEGILQEMWEKWVFIASLAGITCLMRAAIGDIVIAGGADLALALLDECTAIASEQGFSPRAAALQRTRTVLTAAGSPLTASMLRDVEGGGRTEFEHVLGDLMRRGRTKETMASVLRMAYVHLAAYEARQRRLAK
jgi:2-dehydropantoate 2-reductase